MRIVDFSGRERKITSEPIKVEVVGKPQVSPFKANFKQDFPLHSKAQVKTSFCSDPKPRSLKWQWGSLLLLEGKHFPNLFLFRCKRGHGRPRRDHITPLYFFNPLISKCIEIPIISINLCTRPRL